jgi:hypothetical protein
MSHLRPPKPRAYYPLIPHPTRACVLLVETDTGWEPPRLETTEPNVFAGGPLAEWVRAQWGLPVAQLSIVQVHIDPVDQRWDWALIAMENHSTDDTPPAGTCWIDRTALAAGPLAHPEQGPVLAAWLAELESGIVPPARSPWARPGWWPAINAWVATVLAAQGRPLLGPLEQRKVWGISCLLRGETGAGAVYFKGCPTLPLFTNEAALTAELAARYPAHVPTPLAVDEVHRWMLLADFGGPLLDAAPPAAWEATVDAYAALQQASLDQIDALLAAGCLDRRLDRLAAAVPALPAGVRTYNLSLDAAQLGAFAALLPRLEAACAELAGAGIPPALVHGDLHDGNIAVVDGQPLFFDWSDACIAHPFFDLATLIGSEDFGAAPVDPEHLRDRYLQHWTAYASLPDLRRIADLATQLGNLHQVVSYIAIVSNLEPMVRWENAEGIDYFVTRLLTGATPG